MHGAMNGAVAGTVAGPVRMLHSGSAHERATCVSGRHVVAGSGGRARFPDTTAGCRRMNQRPAGGDSPARTGEPSDR